MSRPGAKPPPHPSRVTVTGDAMVTGIADALPRDNLSGPIGAPKEERAIHCPSCGVEYIYPSDYCLFPHRHPRQQ